MYINLDQFLGHDMNPYSMWVIEDVHDSIVCNNLPAEVSASCYRQVFKWKSNKNVFQESQKYAKINSQYKIVGDIVIGYSILKNYSSSASNVSKEALYRHYLQTK